MTFQDQKKKIILRIRDYGQKIDLAGDLDFHSSPQLRKERGGGRLILSNLTPSVRSVFEIAKEEALALV